ncbi:hypothetical protein ACWC0A_36605 [Streptomyces scopuliridis]
MEYPARATGDEGAANDTWAVLDPATGKVRAKVDCAPARGGTAGEADPRVSINVAGGQVKAGDYIVAPPRY